MSIREKGTAGREYQGRGEGTLPPDTHVLRVNFFNEDYGQDDIWLATIQSLLFKVTALMFTSPASAYNCKSFFKSSFKQYLFYKFKLQVQTVSLYKSKLKL